MITEKRNPKKEIELFFRDRQKIKDRKSKDKKTKSSKRHYMEHWTLLDHKVYQQKQL